MDLILTLDQVELQGYHSVGIVLGPTSSPVELVLTTPLSEVEPYL